jgi:hypothetical protein
MKTYPVTRPNGSVQYFDIQNVWNSIRSIQQLLKTIQGVSSIKFGLGLERLTFEYNGELCIVYDPEEGEGGLFYRICPKIASESQLDLSQIHSVFANHRGVLSQLWFEFRSKEIR